jgi:hypothetical protein
MKMQVVSIGTRKAYFTGTGEECQQWIADYGLGGSQFDMLPYDPTREMGDIMETY